MTELFVNLDLKREGCAVAVINREFCGIDECIPAVREVEAEVVKEEDEDIEMSLPQRILFTCVAGTAMVSAFFACLGMGVWGLDYILRNCIMW